MFVNSCKKEEPGATRTRGDRLGDSAIHVDLRRMVGADGEVREAPR